VANSDIRRSYFLSGPKDLAAFYPWQSLDAVLSGADRMTEFRKLYDSPSFTGALWQSNFGRASYWSPVFYDFATDEHRVSNAAAIEFGGHFRGVVGTELALRVFTDLLTSGNRPTGKFVLIDQSGVVVGDSERRSGARDILLRGSDLLKLDTDFSSLPASRFRSIGDEQVVAVPLADVPWMLVHTVPTWDVHRAAIMSIIPYTFILTALLLTLVVAQWVMRRQFIEPVARLTRYVEQEMMSSSAQLPRVSPLWQPWVNRIAQAFRHQRETIARLREEEAFSAGVMEAALDGIITADRNGRIIDFNPAAERIFGHKVDDVRGRKVAEVIVPPHYRPAHESGMRRLIETGTGRVLGRRIELEALHAEGHMLPIELELHQVMRAGKSIFAASIRDLTEVKNKQREIDNHKARLYQAEKMTAMGSLLAGVAHELNNPLAVVIAQTTLLSDTSTSPAQRSRAEKIYAAADRCGRIVKTFLSMARHEDPVRARICLNDAVRAALEVTAYGLRSAGIELDIRLDSQLPPVDGDKDQLAQVVSNLVINAQQALVEQKKPRLTLRSWHGDATVYLEVMDNGPGVPKNVRPRIFEAFFTTKPAGAGTGIGLAVCRNIVQLHGGALCVDDNPEGGAVFRLALPAASTSETAQPAATPTRASGEQALSILVVDDEPDVSEVLVDLLELCGHAARATASPDEALAIVRGGGIDLIMSDLRMPGGGGIGLRSAIQEIDPAMAARFIFVTGDTVVGPATIHAGGGGPAVILEKPFTRADVDAAIRQALRAP
jgi:PAS domain S-box-containing protein